MEYIVERPAEDLLAETEAFLMRRWPYPGFVNRSERAVSYTENPGCLRSVLSFNLKGVQVFATPESEGRSRITVTAGRKKYAEALAPWLDELGAKPA